MATHRARPAMAKHVLMANSLLMVFLPIKIKGMFIKTISKARLIPDI